MRYIEYEYADKLINKSKYLVKDPSSLQRNWSKEFNNNNPIDIEIGMGRGDFIIDMAKKYPNRNFIGIEINESQMVKVVNLLKNMNLNNLRLINGDAIDVDKFFFKEIDTIYLTFPEPWPKKNDIKKRLTNEIYLKKYDKIYKKDKHLILKTDNKIYFAYSLESLSAYWYIFKRVSLDLHHDENNIPNVMTNYEKEYYKEGRPIYYLEAYFH